MSDFSHYFEGVSPSPQEEEDRPWMHCQCGHGRNAHNLLAFRKPCRYIDSDGPCGCASFRFVEWREGQYRFKSGIIIRPTAK